jgi:hypothetical protein
MGLHAPELLILYALDMFLVLSIVTVLFDSNFPMAVPYFFQILSIAGTGNLYMSKVFDDMFTLESRFWYSFFYMDAMILSAFAVTAYLLFLKKNLSKGLMFLGGFSLPSTCFGFYILTFYDDYSSMPMVFSMINGNWVGVMMLVSLLILIKGTKLFMETDPRFSDLQQIISNKITQPHEDIEDQAEPTENEQNHDDHFNPVDHVHVTKYSEINQDELEY